MQKEVFLHRYYTLPSKFTQYFIISFAASSSSTFIYSKNAFSVLCPLILRIKSEGTPFRNWFVQNDRLQVCEDTNSHFSNVFSMVLVPFLVEITTFSVKSASFNISLSSRLKYWLLIWKTE